jgi:hypothetical protein
MTDPNPINQIILFEHLLQKKIPFIFIRFSDGEIEILKNRTLVIDQNKIIFRGRILKNIYPKYDFKNFDPFKSRTFRSDLLKSAMHHHHNFFKGIPTKHNKAIADREFMLRLNGGLDNNITFSDLFMNSNNVFFRQKIIKQFKSFNNISLIANYRAKPIDFLKNANLIKIPDNFFSSYEKTFGNIVKKIESLPQHSLILCSASSLSNVLGYFIDTNFPENFTFIDVGSSMNDFLGLRSDIRTYHLLHDKSLRKLILRNLYKISKNYKLKW